MCCSQMLSSVFSQQPGKVMAFVSCSIYLSRKKGSWLFGYFFENVELSSEKTLHKGSLCCNTRVNSISNMKTWQLSKNVVTHIENGVQNCQPEIQRWSSANDEVVNAMNIESTLFCFLMIRTFKLVLLGNAFFRLHSRGYIAAVIG